MVVGNKNQIKALTKDKVKTHKLNRQVIIVHTKIEAEVLKIIIAQDRLAVAVVVVEDDNYLTVIKLILVHFYY